MNRINIIILGITLLATSLLSQEVGFNDSVKLKNGKVLEKVKAVAIKDSLVVVDSNGAANVYSKKEVSEVVKNDKLSDSRSSFEKYFFTDIVWGSGLNTLEEDLGMMQLNIVQVSEQDCLQEAN
jgi:hypothetical protein